MLKVNKHTFFVFLFFALSGLGYSQTPAPIPTQEEEKETIVTEEIKVNISALDANGKFVSDLKKEDLVIIEDGRLQQANSVRIVPANVLIILDTGGEMRSNLSTTSATAKNLVRSLGVNDNVSVFQYNDKVKMLSDWTTDKAQTLDVLETKPTFGRRSVLNQAIGAAIEFFYKTPLENRHLILITDGTDSFNDSTSRDSVTANLMASNINVHIISYSKIQRDFFASQRSVFIKGEPKPRRLPEEISDTLPDPKGAGKKKSVTPRDVARLPRLGSISLDRERVKRAKENKKEFENGEQFLTRIAEDANGEILLPETFDEMIEGTAMLAKIIDSQYLITYTPKRPVSDSPNGEIRLIEVASKRNGLKVESHRKLFVKGKNN